MLAGQQMAKRFELTHLLPSRVRHFGLRWGLVVRPAGFVCWFVVWRRYICEPPPPCWPGPHIPPVTQKMKETFFWFSGHSHGLGERCQGLRVRGLDDDVEKCNLWGGHARKWGWSAVCMHAALFFGMPAACLQHTQKVDCKCHLWGHERSCVSLALGDFLVFFFGWVVPSRLMPKDFAGASETWNDQTWNNQTWKPIRVGMITMHAWKLMSFHYMLPRFHVLFFQCNHARMRGTQAYMTHETACMHDHETMLHETETSSMHENEAMHAWNGHADMFFPCMHVQAWS